MKSKWILLIIFLAVCTIQGCATADGFKQDTKSIFSGVNDEDSWIQKADAWIQEHAW